MSKPAIDFTKPNKAVEPPAPEPVAVANANAPTAPAATVIIQDPMTLISSRIPAQLHHRMKLFCVATRIDMKDFIAAAISQKLDAEEGKA
jgi:hypothetical protein